MKKTPLYVFVSAMATSSPTPAQNNSRHEGDDSAYDQSPIPVVLKEGDVEPPKTFKGTHPCTEDDPPLLEVDIFRHPQPHMRVPWAYDAAYEEVFSACDRILSVED